MDLLTIGMLVLAAAITGIGLALYAFTLPGLRRLPRKRRAGPDGVTTIEDAVAACRSTGLQAWDLAAFAQDLASRRFEYSRRNPWDSPARAFQRGMGYCQQQALALKLIYDRLGIHSEPVFALQCRFPARVIHGLPEPECLSPHTWLRVRVAGEQRDVCPGSSTNRPGAVHFEVLSPVRPLSPWIRPFSHLGSVIENARRDRKALRQAGLAKR